MQRYPLYLFSFMLFLFLSLQFQATHGGRKIFLHLESCIHGLNPLFHQKHEASRDYSAPYACLAAVLLTYSLFFGSC